MVISSFKEVPKVIASRLQVAGVHYELATEECNPKQQGEDVSEISLRN